jgi:hypothetical protein
MPYDPGGVLKRKAAFLLPQCVCMTDTCKLLGLHSPVTTSLGDWPVLIPGGWFFKMKTWPICSGPSVPEKI